MQGDSDSITQLAVVILLLGMAVPTLGTAYSSAGSPVEYTETTAINYQTDYDLTQSATTEGYAVDQITANGSTLTAGTDYSTNLTAGSINFSNTSTTRSGDTATIEYRATQRSAETETAYLIIAPLMGLFGVFALVTSVRVLWGYVAEIWEATGQ